MAKPFDYSKWDRLEISDDEDTFHPNLDKGLNIRVNRMTRGRKEEELDAEKEKLEKAGKKAEAEKLENKRPLHVDNVCKVTEERTIVNWGDGKRTDRTQKDGEEFSVDEYGMFKSDNKKLLEDFEHADWERSRELLVEQGGILMQDYANNYFMLTALDEEMKGNSKRVQRLGHQGQILSQIHQLAEPMNRPPRDLVHRFFERFTDGGAKQAFDEGVKHFLGHIKRRAVEKKKEEEAEAAEAAPQQAAAGEAGGGETEEREMLSLVEAMYQMSKEERMGPGGLDPVEIFEELPETLQNCFKSGDVEMLKEVASNMDPAEFEGYFKKCIDAGLWRPG